MPLAGFALTRSSLIAMQSLDPLIGSASLSVFRDGDFFAGLATNCGSDLKYGGERGIRTLDRGLTYTPLAGARLQPLGHLSKIGRNHSTTWEKWQG